NRPFAFDASRGLMSGPGSELSRISSPHSCCAGSNLRVYRSQLPFNCCDQTTQGRLLASTAICGSQLSPLVFGTQWMLLHLPLTQRRMAISSCSPLKLSHAPHSEPSGAAAITGESSSRY